MPKFDHALEEQRMGGMPNFVKSWAGAAVLATASVVGAQEKPGTSEVLPLPLSVLQSGVQKKVEKLVPVKTPKQIREDIKKLAGGWKQRNDMTKEFEKYFQATADLDGARILHTEGGNHPDLEISQRSVLILGKVRKTLEDRHLDLREAQKYADRKPKDYPVAPWADSDDKNTDAALMTMKYFPGKLPQDARSPYLKKARDEKIPDGRENDWQAYREAMKGMLVEVAKEEIRKALLIADPKLRKKAVEDAVDAYLEEMKKGDIAWRNSLNMPSLVPKKEEEKPGPDF